MNLRRIIRSKEGKTVIIDLEVHNCRILRIEIWGDFFVYPEEAIEELEKLLIYCNSDACIKKAFEKVMNNSYTLGFSWEELRNSILEMFHELCRSRTSA